MDADELHTQVAVGNEYFPRQEIDEAATMMHDILSYYASTQVSRDKGKGAHPLATFFYGVPRPVSSTEDEKRAPERAIAVIKCFNEMYRAAVYNDGDQLEPDEERRGWQKKKGWQNATEVICLLETRYSEELVWIKVLRDMRKAYEDLGDPPPPQIPVSPDESQTFQMQDE